MNSIIFTIVLLLTLKYAIQIENIAKYVILLNSEFRFTDYIISYTCVTGTTCAALCIRESACIIASFDETALDCYLHSNDSATFEATGIIHFLKLEDATGTIPVNRDLMKGARAWQSSTYYDGPLHANLALDGNTATHWNDNSCATTGNNYSYWAMEFGTAGYVTSVDIYLRSDYVERNTNRTVLISQTEHDVNITKGTLCGGYFGPLITSPPFILTITCPRPVYGRFMRISHEAADVMEICEVIVHSI